MTDKKRTAPLDWEDLRHFVALARHGSLSAAARALRVNHATVSRRVAGLEATLGRVLFDRRADGYVLTAEGRLVLERADAMDQAALAILRQSDVDGGLTGPVRLTTTRVLADGFLVDRLAALRRNHPGIDLELVAEARVMSLSRREADIALRFGQPGDSELVARRVAAVSFAFYASSECSKRMADGQEPPLVGFDEDSTFVPEAAWLARRFPGRRFAFRSNSQSAQAAAVRADYGVALLPCFLAAPDCGLVPVAFGETPPDRDLWLLVRRELARVPRVRAVADGLAELLHRERATLAKP